MAATSNTFEGLSNGTGITTGNSGGASGDAFDLMTLGSGATATADTSKSAHGAVSMKLATGVSAADCVAEWTSKIGTSTTLFVRMYLWIGSNPGTNHRLFDLVAAPNLCGAIYLTTTGKLQPVDTGGGQMAISTNSIPLSQWFRVEAKYTASTTIGQAEVRLYNSPDSTTATEIVQSTASFNTQASFNEYRFGAAGDPMPANRTVWYDDIGLSTVDFLGPAGSAALAPVLKPGRTWERRFKHQQTLFVPPAIVVTGTPETGQSLGAATAQATAVKVAVQGAVCSAAGVSSGGASKSTAARGQTYGASTAQASGRKVAPKAGQTYAASTAQAGGRKAAPVTARTYAAGTAQSDPRKVALAAGSAFGVGFAYWTAAVAPRAQGAVCGAAGMASGRATHVAVRTGPAYAAGAMQGRSTKKSVQGGTSSAAGTCQGAGRKIARAAGHCSAAVAAQANSRKLVLQAGRSYGAGYVQAERRALSCSTPRPDLGTTARPSSGGTTRPDSGITARTSAGITARPDVGVTERPCIKT